MQSALRLPARALSRRWVDRADGAHVLAPRCARRQISGHHRFGGRSHVGNTSARQGPCGVARRLLRGVQLLERMADSAATARQRAQAPTPDPARRMATSDHDALSARVGPRADPLGWLPVRRQSAGWQQDVLLRAVLVLEQAIFCEHLDLLTVRWTRPNAWSIAIDRRGEVAKLDAFVGPKR